MVSKKVKVLSPALLLSVLAALVLPSAAIAQSTTTNKTPLIPGAPTSPPYVCPPQGPPPPVGDGPTPKPVIPGDTTPLPPPTGFVDPTHGNSFPAGIGRDRTVVRVHRNSRGPRMVQTIRPDELTDWQIQQINGILGINMLNGAQAIDVNATNAQLEQIQDVMHQYVPYGMKNGRKNVPYEPRFHRVGPGQRWVPPVDEHQVGPGQRWVPPVNEHQVGPGQRFVPNVNEHQVGPGTPFIYEPRHHAVGPGTPFIYEPRQHNAGPGQKTIYEPRAHNAGDGIKDVYEPREKARQAGEKWVPPVRTKERQGKEKTNYEPRGKNNQGRQEKSDTVRPSTPESSRYSFRGPVPTVKNFSRWLVILGVVMATVWMALAAWSMVFGSPYGGARVIQSAFGLMLLLSAYTIWKIVQMNTFHANSDDNITADNAVIELKRTQSINKVPVGTQDAIANKAINRLEDPSASIANQAIQRDEDPGASIANQAIQRDEDPNAVIRSQAIQRVEDPGASIANQAIIRDEDPSARLADQAIIRDEDLTQLNRHTSFPRDEDLTQLNKDASFPRIEDLTQLNKHTSFPRDEDLRQLNSSRPNEALQSDAYIGQPDLPDVPSGGRPFPQRAGVPLEPLGGPR